MKLDKLEEELADLWRTKSELAADANYFFGSQSFFSVSLSTRAHFSRTRLP